MSSIDTAALLAPVSDSAPAGEDLRASDAYEQIAAEIEKLTSPTSTTPTDWALVERESASLLATGSKDFMLAAWLNAAWMERHGIDGLRAGIELHAGLVETYWQTAYPPLKRLRGRRNALTWWLDRATRWLETHELPAIPAANQNAMVDAANRIDSALAELDPESPPLASFLRYLKNLDIVAEETEVNAGPVASNDGTAGGPVNESTGGAASAATEGAATPANGGAGNMNPGSASSLAAPSRDTVQNANTAGQEPASAASRPAATGIATPAASLPALPDQLVTMGDITAALEGLGGHLSHISNALLTLDPYQPLAIEINRFAARASILEAPPATAGATSIMAPPAPILDAFQTICAANNAVGMTTFCESRIPAFPFWLDLDRQSARGFAMLGERGVRMQQAVVRNALAFTARLPGIENLTFADGTPFASDETRAWLEECRAAEDGGTAHDEFESAQQQARAAAADGRYGVAMQALQDLLQRSRSGRDRLRARIALLELLVTRQDKLDPLPAARSIFEDTIRLSLADWEPDLASQALQTVLKACRQAAARSGAPIGITAPDTAAIADHERMREEALQQLARLDFLAATQFMKPRQ